jgi:Fur family ferric uptake transcriptional regulator
VDHSSYPTALRDAGLRVTQQRLAVLEALDASPHAPVDHIVDRVQQRLGTVSVQAVYDVLDALEGARLVRRIELPGHARQFETRVDDNHHHLVCRSCGRVEDVDCVVGEAPCLTPSDNHGFTVESAEVVFSGLCATCAAGPRA